jgi:hypothetical protein
VGFIKQTNIMKTKTITTIAELNREDLVDLLSTALCGNSYLSASYAESEHDNGESCEDAMATILLNGECIIFTDHYAEGEVYSDWASLDERGNGLYPVYLNDFKRGLERAANGTFKASTDMWRDEGRNAFYAFACNTDDWDVLMADCLMQIILFDEIVYG